MIEPTLPNGFTWRPRWQHDRSTNSVWYRGECVAFVDDRVGGAGWIARLDSHQRGFPPLRIRHCTTLEAGRRGCVLWVIRHQHRLRAEVDEIEANRPALKWKGGALPDQPGTSSSTSDASKYPPDTLTAAGTSDADP
jgi:hypothetical protein